MSGQDVGYIRVSSTGQDTDRQLEGIKLTKIFTEKVSGKDRNRPQLESCLDYVREGDNLHVHSLDKLGRSLQDLETIVTQLVEKGVTVIFHKEKMTFNKENNGSMGKLLFQILAAFAEFERNLIRERQKEGIELARAKGKHLGRQSKLTRGQKQDILKKYEHQYYSITALAKEFSVSRGTIYNVINEIKQKQAV